MSMNQPKESSALSATSSTCRRMRIDRITSASATLRARTHYHQFNTHGTQGTVMTCWATSCTATSYFMMLAHCSTVITTVTVGKIV